MTGALRERLGTARPGEPAWLGALRADALARFAERGLPTSRLEDWKYTGSALRALDLDALALAPCAPRIEGGDGAASALGDVLAGARGDSRGEPDDAGLEGRLGSLADPKRDAFAALNTACFDGGAVVRVPRDAALDAPVRVAFEAAPGMQHPRLWLEAAATSRAVVVVDFASRAGAGGGGSLGARFTNALAELRVGPGARLDVVWLQREDDAALHVSRLFARVERGGSLRVVTLALGGALVRNDVEVVLAEEGAAVDLDGLFLGSGTRHVDNHTLVDHAVPHCTSRELYKGVLADRSRGVFRGRVVVRPDAQKTSAEQRNPNLLLSPHAEIDTKPQLEIWADDVRCSHGSTIGQLDRDALFFLRSRGIARGDAHRMLVEAFASEVVDDVAALAGDVLGAAVRERVRAAIGGAAGLEGAER